MQEVRIHQPIIDAVITCLKAVFEEEKVADKEVSFLLKQNKNFGSRDRSMIAESVYDIVRWKLKYTHQLERYHPALTMYKHLILVSLLNRKYTIKNPEIFDVTNDKVNELLNVIEQPISDKYIEQSYPEAFYNYCLESIGNDWHSLAKALNQKPSVFVRVNSLKITAEEISSLLEKENITFQIAGTNCIEILSKNNLKNSDLYRQGLFEFQDIGSQAIGTFLFDTISDTSKIKDITILDLCAGAGGKTLHLAALLNNQGKIYATDYKASRLKNLQQRAEQAGCKNVQIIDFREAKKLNKADIILIDAPCSGTGTFKRQADLKYKISPAKINEYEMIQASLLNEYKNLLAKNGRLIYATCSVLPQENQLQVKNFLKNNPSFKLEKEVQLLPTTYNGDGFYMASLHG